MGMKQNLSIQWLHEFTTLAAPKFGLNVTCDIVDGDVVWLAHKTLLAWDMYVLAREHQAGAAARDDAQYRLDVAMAEKRIQAQKTSGGA